MLHKISGTREGIRFIYLFKIDLLKDFFDYSDFAELIREPLIVNTSTYPEVYNRIYARFMEISNLYFFYNSVVKETPIFSHLLGIIGMLSKSECNDGFEMPHNDKQREIYIKLRSLLEWLSIHYSDSVTMEEAANYVGYSKFHFARIFKEYTGMTFYDYQTNLKLKSVVEKLADTDLSISEIALSSGFNNLTSLSRNFETHYGCSPSQYRQRIRRTKRS
jgi:AraC-like DNA-binding protein